MPRPKPRINPVELILRAMPIDGRCLTPADIAQLADLDLDYVRKKLRELERMGLARAQKGKPCYWLTESGIERRDACTVGVVAAMPKKNRKKPENRDWMTPAWEFRQRLWNAMRIQGNFDRNTLLTMAKRAGDKWPVHYVNAYLKVLERYGVILRIKKVKQFPRYRLMENLGPLAPYWNDNAETLFDRNAEKYLPLPTAEDAA